MSILSQKRAKEATDFLAFLSGKKLVSAHQSFDALYQNTKDLYEYADPNHPHPGGIIGIKRSVYRDNKDEHKELIHAAQIRRATYKSQGKRLTLERTFQSRNQTPEPTPDNDYLNTPTDHPSFFIPPSSEASHEPVYRQNPPDFDYADLPPLDLPPIDQDLADLIHDVVLVLAGFEDIYDVFEEDLEIARPYLVPNPPTDDIDIPLPKPRLTQDAFLQIKDSFPELKQALLDIAKHIKQLEAPPTPTQIFEHRRSSSPNSIHTRTPQSTPSKTQSKNSSTRPIDNPHPTETQPYVLTEPQIERLTHFTQQQIGAIPIENEEQYLLDHDFSIPFLKTTKRAGQTVVAGGLKHNYFKANAPLYQHLVPLWKDHQTHFVSYLTKNQPAPPVPIRPSPPKISNPNLTHDTSSTAHEPHTDPFYIKLEPELIQNITLFILHTLGSIPPLDQNHIHELTDICTPFFKTTLTDQNELQIVGGLLEPILLANQDQHPHLIRLSNLLQTHFVQQLTTANSPIDKEKQIAEAIVITLDHCSKTRQYPDPVYQAAWGIARNHIDFRNFQLQTTAHKHHTPSYLRFKNFPEVQRALTTWNRTQNPNFNPSIQPSIQPHTQQTPQPTKSTPSIDDINKLLLSHEPVPHENPTPPSRPEISHER